MKESEIKDREGIEFQLRVTNEGLDDIIKVVGNVAWGIGPDGSRAPLATVKLSISSKGFPCALTALQMAMAEKILLERWWSDAATKTWADIANAANKIAQPGDGFYLGEIKDNTTKLYRKRTPEEIREAKLQRLADAKLLANSILGMKSALQSGKTPPGDFGYSDAQLRVINNNLASMVSELCNAISGRDPKMVKQPGAFYEGLVSKAQAFLKEVAHRGTSVNIWEVGSVHTPAPPR